MATVGAGDDESDEDDDDDDSDVCDEETNLESYTTSLDDEDCEIDEFVIFKNTITGKRIHSIHI